MIKNQNVLAKRGHFDAVWYWLVLSVRVVQSHLWGKLQRKYRNQCTFPGRSRKSHHPRWLLLRCTQARKRHTKCTLRWLNGPSLMLLLRLNEWILYKLTSYSVLNRLISCHQWATVTLYSALKNCQTLRWLICHQSNKGSLTLTQ